MELLTLVIMLALVQLIVFGALVGMARTKYGIKAPAVTGNEIFERYYRVHYNSIEQVVVFLPAVWAFGYYIGQYWAAGLGVVYLLGRTIYAIGYIKAPENRGPGTLVTMVANWILVIGSIVGAIRHLI